MYEREGKTVSKKHEKFMDWDLYSKIPFCYPHIVRYELRDCKSLLDLGCGSYPLKAKLGLDLEYSVGVEVVPKSARAAEEYLEAIIQDDIRNVELEVNSFDAVVAIDVLEHFDRHEALELISKMEKWARNVVILVTPNGQTRGFIDPDLPSELAVFQKHECGFSFSELEELGFEVYGIRGLKAFRRIRRKIPFVRLFSLGTQLFCKYRPNFASGLLGVKKLW